MIAGGSSQRRTPNHGSDGFRTPTPRDITDAELRALGFDPEESQSDMEERPTTFHWEHLREVPLGEISTNRSISPCPLNSLITKSTYLTSIMAKEQLLRGVNSRRAGGQLEPLAVGKDRLCIAVFILPQRHGNNYHA